MIDPSESVSLADAIRHLRLELQDALNDGRSERLRFLVESVELELTVGVSDTAKAEGSVSMWRVLSIGASAQTAISASHKIVLQLKPRDTFSDDESTLIGDR
jgi:Trypsin-co-occurring domain 2